MMDILHINSNYLTSKLHENLIDQLANANIENTIYMPIKEEMESRFVFDSKYHVLAPIAFNHLDKYFFTHKQNKIYRQLIHLVNPSQYDMVHAHTLFTDGNIALTLKEAFNLPYVVTVRSFTDLDSFFRLRINLRSRGRKILEKAEKIIFLSEESRQELLGKYISNSELKAMILDKSIIIPNGIDNFYFEHLGQEKSLDLDTGFRCIQIGKITPRKNALGTVKALKKLSEKYPFNIKLQLVGEIVDQDYANKIRRIGLDFVEFVDHQSPGKLIELLRESDIFIMPSISETFGLVYAEAMSQGVPVIYSKNQGFDGQFPDGLVGYAVNPKNTHDIVEKVELILQNYNQMSENCMRYVNKFRWSDLGKQYIDIYTQILRKYGNRRV